MPSGRRKERREAKQASLALEHSFLFRIPRRFAWLATIALFCAVTLAERLAPKDIWFGPIYLAVIALAAWSLNSRTAIALGLAALSIKLATGTLPYYSPGSDLAFANIATRIIGIAIVAGFIGIARRSCEREWRFARTDQLTGALNRQAFFEIIASQQCRTGWAAIIYADIDGLKKVNDGRGHDQGDLCLRLFSEKVRNTIRKEDVFARMGGDEFVIFMKLKDEQAGETVARRLHEAINAKGADDLSHLSCSLGVLVLPEGSRSIDDELRAADNLMYKAKQANRGVLVSRLADDHETPGLSQPVSATRQNERGSSVRKAGRAGVAADKPAAPSPRPEPRTAA